MQEAASNFSSQTDYLHGIKAKIAPILAIVVREIAETGHNPENTLTDIVKLARILDISAPADRNTPSSFTDPRYNLVDYLKRATNSQVLREINPDEILFDRHKPFTCISQIQEILEDVSDKVSRNFVAEAQYA